MKCGPNAHVASAWMANASAQLRAVQKPEAEVNSEGLLLSTDVERAVDRTIEKRIAFLQSMHGGLITWCKLVGSIRGAKTYDDEHGAMVGFARYLVRFNIAEGICTSGDKNSDWHTSERS